MQRKISNFGFTITEILVVLAILALLTAILFPVFNIVKRSAKSKSNASKQIQIVDSVILYSADHDDRLPTAASNSMAYDINHGIAPGYPFELFTSMESITSSLISYTHSAEVFQLHGCEAISDPRWKSSCEFAFRYDEVAGVYGMETNSRANSSWVLLADGAPDDPDDPSNGMVNCTFLDSHSKRIHRLECLDQLTVWIPN